MASSLLGPETGKEVKCYVCETPGAPLVPGTIRRREPGAKDIGIDIKFAGEWMDIYIYIMG